MIDKINTIIRQLGPGLLFAGAAIGSSHLVQSTRAGAFYGFDLWIVIVLIHLVKYPFFQFAPRYAAATGENLLQGYHKLGKGYLIFFLIITLATIFAIQATVTIVTVGIIENIFHFEIEAWIMSALLLTLMALILLRERFDWLEKTMKFIIFILTVSTFIAVISGISRGYQPPEPTPFEWGATGIFFLITLMGWMPSPLDLSVWVSIWNQQKYKQLGKKMKLSDTLRDFHIGYWGTMLIALAFLALGALAMHGKNISFEARGDLFAGQLIDLYTQLIGPWIYWIIAIAALTTMLSTTLTCFDAQPRVLQESVKLLWPQIAHREKRLYRIFLIGLGAGSVLILAQFVSSMQMMVNVANILSFMTAPAIAWLNLRVVTKLDIHHDFKPNKSIKAMSYAGITFLLVFALVYLWTLFGNSI